MFPEAKAWSVEGSSCDRMPLYLVTNSVGRRIFARRLRYDNSWGKLPDCRDVVDVAWFCTRDEHIATKLVRCGREVWGWGRR